MKLYLSTTHSDEDGPMAMTGKMAMIYGSHEELMQLCDFFDQVKMRLASTSEPLHMQFRDHLADWDWKQNVDIAITLEN